MKRPTMNSSLHRLFRIATWLVWATFACRVLTPVGYMPAAIADGGPFILCPGGTQAELVSYLAGARGHAHHAGHHGTQDAAEHDRHGEGADCPLGASFAPAAPTEFQPAAAIDTAAILSVRPVVAAFSTAHTPRYHSRAPPVRRDV